MRRDRSKKSVLDEAEKDLRRDREARNSIILTWQISFDHIHRARPSAAKLLSLMSLCDRQAIPESLVRGGVATEMKMVERKAVSSTTTDLWMEVSMPALTTAPTLVGLVTVWTIHSTATFACCKDTRSYQSPPMDRCFKCTGWCRSLRGNGSSHKASWKDGRSNMSAICAPPFLPGVTRTRPCVRSSFRMRSLL